VRISLDRLRAATREEKAWEPEEQMVSMFVLILSRLPQLDVLFPVSPHFNPYSFSLKLNLGLYLEYL